MACTICSDVFRQVVKEEMLEQIKKDILLPTIKGMRAEGKPFIGCLFAGMNLTFVFQLSANCQMWLYIYLYIYILILIYTSTSREYCNYFCCRFSISIGSFLQH